MQAPLSLSINPKFYFCGGDAASFVFPLTCAVEKHIISEKPLNKRFFKGTGVVLAGIECSPKIFDFRANGIPVQERVEKVDTLKWRRFSAPFLNCPSVKETSCITAAGRQTFFIRIYYFPYIVSGFVGKIKHRKIHRFKVVTSVQPIFVLQE